MTGKLFSENGDLMVLHENVKLPTLSDDFYKWFDIYISNDEMEIDVNFDIETAEYFDQTVTYAKFIHNGKTE